MPRTIEDKDFTFVCREDAAKNFIVVDIAAIGVDLDMIFKVYKKECLSELYVGLLNNTKYARNWLRKRTESALDWREDMTSNP